MLAQRILKLDFRVPQEPYYAGRGSSSMRNAYFDAPESDFAPPLPQKIHFIINGEVSFLETPRNQKFEIDSNPRVFICLDGFFGISHSRVQGVLNLDRRE